MGRKGGSEEASEGREGQESIDIWVLFHCQAALDALNACIFTTHTTADNTQKGSSIQSVKHQLYWHLEWASLDSDPAFALSKAAKSPRRQDELKHLNAVPLLFILFVSVRHALGLKMGCK